MKARLNEWLTVLHPYRAGLLRGGLVFAALGGLFGVYRYCSGANSAPQAAALAVRVAKVETRMVTPSIASTGQIEALDKAEIYSKTQGRIERFFVDQGQSVKAGDLLLQMERLPLEIQLGAQQSRYNAALAGANLAATAYQNARRDVEIRWKQIAQRETAARQTKAVLDRTQMTFKGQTILYREGGLSPEQYRVARTDLITREAEYRQAIKELEIAKVGYRDQDLQKGGLPIPADDAEKYRLFTELNTRLEKSQVDVARAQAEAERSAMADTRRLLNETAVRSPIDGVIATRAKSPGEEISVIGSATSSAPLLTIVSIDSVYAVVAVREGDSRSVRPGLKLRFTVDVFPGAAFEGEVKLVSPVVDPATHTVSVKALVENPNRDLKPGMFLRGEVVTGEDRPAIMIPVTAFQALEDGKARVWVLKENRPFPVEVKPGRRIGDEQEITEGPLQAGDLVIIEKLSLLAEDRAVEPVLPGAPGAGQ